MANKLLLSTFEVAVVVAIGILVVVFAYVVFRKIFSKIKVIIDDKKTKKAIEKAIEETREEPAKKEEKPSEKKEEKKEDKYTQILEKVHQNREQYFKEIDTLKEKGQAAQTEEVRKPLVADERDFVPEDFDVLEEINFDNNDFDFGDFDVPSNNEAPDELPATDFMPQFRRQRMIRRSQTISQEISSCSNRIKAIIALDIINKPKFKNH